MAETSKVIEHAREIASRVNLHNYPEYALQTERVPEQPVVLSDELAGLLMNLLTVADDWALVTDGLKRHIFYGKGPSLQIIHDNLEAGAAWQEQPFLGAMAGGGSPLLYPIEYRMLHGALGKLTEALELLQMLRAYFEGKSPSFDLFHIGEELGDDDWYTALIQNTTGLDRQSWQIANIAKLCARYPNKFNSTDAFERDLPRERALLEEYIAPPSPTLDTGRPAEHFSVNSGSAVK